jgi:hypothetical protein
VTPLEPPPLAWYTSPGHPRGAEDAPCFEVLGTFVYPAQGHPAGSSARPWYQVRGEFAYAVDGHPEGPSREPCFWIAGTGVYPLPMDQDPIAADAWFRIGRRPT